MEKFVDDIKVSMENFRKSQEFVEECPEKVRIFLEPTIKLAGDFICDICYEKGVDPVKIEDD